MLAASRVTVALVPARVHFPSAVRARVKPPPLLATTGTPLTCAPDLPVILVTWYSPTGHSAPPTGAGDPADSDVVDAGVWEPDPSAVGEPAVPPEHALSRDNSP